MAVVREVKEEAGIEVDPASIRYEASQPWPFPQSLMIGFQARAAQSSDTAESSAEVDRLKASSCVLSLRKQHLMAVDSRGLSQSQHHDRAARMG